MGSTWNNSRKGLYKMIPILLLKNSFQKTNPSVLGGNEYDNTKEYIDKLYDKLQTVKKFLFTVICPYESNAVELYNYINNVLQPNFAIDHHLNGGGGIGSEIFCYTKGASNWLSECIYKKVSAVTPWDDRGIKNGMAWGDNGLRFIRELKCPSLLIELLFQDDEVQMKYFIDHMDELVNAEFEGICEFFKIPTPENKEVKTLDKIIVFNSIADGYIAGLFSSKINAPIIAYEIIKDNPELIGNYKEVHAIGGNYTVNHPNVIYHAIGDRFDTAKNIL
jgi:hypothetical protein